MNREEAREAAKVMLAYADGAEIEWKDGDRWGYCVGCELSFDWYGKDYRVKPRKPSIDWDHVTPVFKWIAVDRIGAALIFISKPELTTDGFGNYMDWFSENGSFSAKAFASFDPGNCDWKDSLVERPK